MVRDGEMKKDTIATPRDTEKYLLVYGTGKWEGMYQALKSEATLDGTLDKAVLQNPFWREDGLRLGLTSNSCFIFCGSEICRSGSREEPCFKIL